MILMDSSLENIKLLIEKAKININFHDPETLKTPLMVAIEMGRIDIIGSLINYQGIELNGRDANNITTLHYAIKLGLPYLVRMLWEKGANFGEDLNNETKDLNSEEKDLDKEKEKENVLKEIIRIAKLLGKDDIIQNFRAEFDKIKAKEAGMQKKVLPVSGEETKVWESESNTSVSGKPGRSRKRRNKNKVKDNTSNTQTLKNIGLFSANKSTPEGKKYTYTFENGLFKAEDMTPIEASDTQYKNSNYLIYEPKTRKEYKQLAECMTGYAEDKEEEIIRLLKVRKHFCREKGQPGIARKVSGKFKLKGKGQTTGDPRIEIIDLPADPIIAGPTDNPEDIALLNKLAPKLLVPAIFIENHGDRFDGDRFDRDKADLKAIANVISKQRQSQNQSQEKKPQPGIRKGYSQ